MEVVYMGIISKIFNAIFNAILSPVFKFISSLLETVLSWLFDAVLKPLLLNVLQPLYTALLELVLEILGSIIYSIYASFLQVVDAMQSAFNVFAGLENVTNTKANQTGSLLQILFQLDTVQKAVWTMIMIGFVLLLMFAILGTLRSMADIDGESQRPISRVLSGVFRGMLRLLLIPAASLFAIMMAGYILAGINSAMGGSESSLARMVFVVSSLDAAREDRYNISSSNPVQNIGTGDELRKLYYSGDRSYSDKTRVEKDFKFGKFDYVIGFACGIFLMIVMGISMFNFISRIFDVLILFLAAPFFASVMPLDDGEKFKAWQDMFVAKLFGGYGTVMAMELYMMLCPSVMNGTIVFGQGSTEANYLIRMIFLLGGAWAVVKAGPNITQLLNYQAGMAEMDANRSTLAFGHQAAGLVGGAAMSIGRGLGAATSKAYRGYKGWRDNKNEALQESDKRISARLGFGPDGKQTVRRAGAGAMLSPGLPGPGGGGAHGLPGGGSAAGTGSGGLGHSLPGGGSAAGTGAQTAHAGGSPAAAAAAATAEERSGGAHGESRIATAIDNPPGGGAFEGEGMATGSSAEAAGVGVPGVGSTTAAAETAGTAPAAGTGQGGKDAPRRVASLFGGHVTLNKSRGGYYYPGLDFGKKLQFGRNADGTFSGHFLGMGWRVGQDGKLDKVRLPFVRMKKYDDGKMHVSKYRIPLTGVRCRRYEKVVQNSDGTVKRTNLGGTDGHGSYYVSESKIGGYRARYDQKTGKKETLSKFGVHYAKNADDEYVKTHQSLFGVRVEFEKKDDGSYQAVHHVGNLSEGDYSHDSAGKTHMESLTGLGNYERDAQGNQPYRDHYIFKRESAEGREKK